MFNITKSIALILMGLPALTMAEPTKEGGSHAGNGGNAVVCYRDATRKTIESIELFDYWESLRTRPEFGKVDLGPENLPVSKKIQLFIDRVRIYDVDRANSYSQYAAVLLKDLPSYIVADLPNAPIDDDTPLALPAEPCYKEQFAIQDPDPTPGSRRFRISGRLFNHPKTSNTTRAGILLHEIVYRMAIVREHHKDSNGSRLMHTVYATEKFEKVDSVDLRTFYQTAKMPFFETKGTYEIKPYGVKVLVDYFHTDENRGCFLSGLRLGTKDFRIDVMAIEDDFNELCHGFKVNPISKELEQISPFNSRTRSIKTLTLKTKINGFWTTLATDNAKHFRGGLEVNFGTRKRIKGFSILDTEYGATLLASRRIELKHAGKSYSCAIASSRYLGIVLDDSNDSGKVLGCLIDRGQILEYSYRGQNLKMGCRSEADCSKLDDKIYRSVGNYVEFSRDGQLVEGSPREAFMGIAAQSGHPISMLPGYTSFGVAGEILFGNATIPLPSANPSAYHVYFSGPIESKKNGTYWPVDYQSGYTNRSEGKLIAESISPVIEGFMMPESPTVQSVSCNQLFGSFSVTGYSYIPKVSFPRINVFESQTYYDVAEQKFRTITDDSIYSVKTIACSARADLTIFTP